MQIFCTKSAIFFAKFAVFVKLRGVLCAFCGKMVAAQTRHRCFWTFFSLRRTAMTIFCGQFVPFRDTVIPRYRCRAPVLSLSGYRDSEYLFCFQPLSRHSRATTDQSPSSVQLLRFQLRFKWLFMRRFSADLTLTLGTPWYDPTKCTIIKILLCTTQVRDRYGTQARDNRLKNASFPPLKVYDY